MKEVRGHQSILEPAHSIVNGFSTLFMPCVIPVMSEVRSGTSVQAGAPFGRACACMPPRHRGTANTSWPPRKAAAGDTRQVIAALHLVLSVAMPPPQRPSHVKGSPERCTHSQAVALPRGISKKWFKNRHSFAKKRSSYSLQRPGCNNING